MFNQEQIAKALDALVGKVEWIYSHRNLQDGLDIIFRVDGELRGLWLYDEKRGQVFDAPQRGPAWSVLVVEPLARERCLNLAAYFEEGSNGRLNLLTDAERKEWRTTSEQKRREREEREALRRVEQEEAERRQLQALKEKYEDGPAR